MREGGPRIEAQQRKRFLRNVYKRIEAAIEDGREVTLSMDEQEVDIVDFMRVTRAKAKNGVTTWTITFKPRGLDE